MATSLYGQTSSEINNDYFTVEKSADGINFNVMNYYRGAGNSDKVINYSGTDNKPFAIITYYRLKQTDFDGNFTYSNVVSVNTNIINQSLIETNFYNIFYRKYISPLHLPRIGLLSLFKSEFTVRILLLKLVSIKDWLIIFVFTETHYYK